MIRSLYVPMSKPDDVKPHLAKEDHWRPGYSAERLATTWFNSKNDFPKSVREVLTTAPEYAKAELLDGFFEREVELGSPGRNSQTDLMVIAGLANELGIIAVEGKVDEPFSELVEGWNTTAGKQQRLQGLCETLELDVTSVGKTRYQLLHRTASAIYEAKRYRCRNALMLVHSFSSTHRWFEDFATFSKLTGMPLDAPGCCSSAKVCQGVSLRLAWVADRGLESSVIQHSSGGFL